MTKETQNPDLDAVDENKDGKFVIRARMFAQLDAVLDLKDYPGKTVAEVLGEWAASLQSDYGAFLDDERTDIDLYVTTKEDK